MAMLLQEPTRSLPQVPVPLVLALALLQVLPPAWLPVLPL
jgi:hypothetical protein